MRIIRLALKLLEPVNYYYTASGRGNRTSYFIGDIALKYAMLHQLGLGNFPYPGTFKPEYDELNAYSFWFTVGVPGDFVGVDDRQPEYMKPLMRNTMQGIEYNGTNVNPKIKVGQIMYKNLYFQQFLKPGSTFYSLFIDDGTWKIPDVLRIGTGRTGVIQVCHWTGKPFDAYLNLYTLENIMKINKEKLSKLEWEFSEHAILQYLVIGPVHQENLLDLFDIY